MQDRTELVSSEGRIYLTVPLGIYSICGRVRDLFKLQFAQVKKMSETIDRSMGRVQYHIHSEQYESVQ